MNLDVGADRHVDATRVPDELAALIPYVRRWGYQRNADQDEFVARMSREHPDEVTNFKAICDKNHPAFHKWLCSIPQKHKDEMTDADWSHPKFAFCSMYSVRELFPLEDHEITPEIQATLDREKASNRRRRYLEAVACADDAFRDRNYAKYVELLQDFEDLMDGAIPAKFAMAKKRSGLTNA